MASEDLASRRRRSRMRGRAARRASDGVRHARTSQGCVAPGRDLRGGDSRAVEDRQRRARALRPVGPSPGVCVDRDQLVGEVDRVDQLELQRARWSTGSSWMRDGLDHRVGDAPQPQQIGAEHAGRMVSVRVAIGQASRIRWPISCSMPAMKASSARRLSLNIMRGDVRGQDRVTLQRHRGRHDLRDRVLSKVANAPIDTARLRIINGAEVARRLEARWLIRRGSPKNAEFTSCNILAHIATSFSMHLRDDLVERRVCAGDQARRARRRSAAPTAAGRCRRPASAGRRC